MPRVEACVIVNERISSGGDHMSIRDLKRFVEDDAFGEILCTVGFQVIGVSSLQRHAIGESDIATHTRHAPSRP